MEDGLVLKMEASGKKGEEKDGREGGRVQRGAEDCKKVHRMRSAQVNTAGRTSGRAIVAMAVLEFRHTIRWN